MRPQVQYPVVQNKTCNTPHYLSYFLIIPWNLSYWSLFGCSITQINLTWLSLTALGSDTWRQILFSKVYSPMLIILSSFLGEWHLKFIVKWTYENLPHNVILQIGYKNVCKNLAYCLKDTRRHTMIHSLSGYPRHGSIPKYSIKTGPDITDVW
jgi:hypothetical protein